jgi:type I restriction enzyme S subunit
MLQAGDTLISTANSKEMVGKCSFVSELLFEATLGGFIAAVRPHKHLINPGYLYNWLNSPDVQITLRRTARQTTNIANLPLSQVAKLKIPLPPNPEQEHIVTILDAAEELRWLREQADRRTADLIPALFHEMFGDPATNPKGWPIVHVRDVMTSCEYGTSKKGNEGERGLPVIRMGNVTTKGNLDLSNLKHVELSEAEQEKFRLQEGDVLFNRTNSRELVGKTGMWDGRFPAVAASYFIRLRFNTEKEHPQHFTTFMNLPRMKRELAGMARGAVGQANINGKELQSILFPLPPISLQREFAAHVAEIRAMEVQQAESRRRLDDLFHSLLNRAFRGDL